MPIRRRRRWLTLRTRKALGDLFLGPIEPANKLAKYANLCHTEA